MALKLRNNFTDEQKAVWAWDYWCHAPNCKSNIGVSIHHIFGRVSNSILNSIPLCDKCHRNYTFLDKSELLKTTIRFLCDPNNGYEFTKKDIEFYNTYKKYYE